MPRIRCVLLEEIGQAQLYLRRYTPSADTERQCPTPWGYHNAKTPIGTAPLTTDARGIWRLEESFVAWPDRMDPRWPLTCEACGAQFAADDEWQRFWEALYRRPDTGEVTTLHDAPAGAMWYADWMCRDEAPRYRGPDGRCLVVKTPGGDWMVDGPSWHENGTLQADPGWTRTGTVPDVTAHPSILMHRGKYHGWLKAGWLEDA